MPPNTMPENFHPVDLIVKKRDGGELTTAEMQSLIQAVVERRMTEAQTASFLMAVFQRGLSLGELGDLTGAMRHSGTTLVAPPDTFTVDKHSTGGVGDKTSLLIAPILAAAAAEASACQEPGLPRIAVPMISGRSLGHTGGTLDKLETIPGFCTQLSLRQITELLPKTHALLVGQTPDLVPADRILYALRDHTGTVESPFLITASIMSKKLAEDLRGLVLDVKVGSGAFMSSYESSKQLAELLVATGTQAGTRTVALLSSMEEPLGRYAGNWLEVQECVHILQGQAHPLSADLLKLSFILSGHMLHLAGRVPTPEAGIDLAAKLVHSGAAYTAWLRIVEAQGGDVTVFSGPEVHRPRAMRTLAAPTSGYLAAMDCKQVGWAIQRLGAGRARPGDPVSAYAGLEVHAKLGTHLHAGQPLFTLFSEDPELLEEPSRMLLDTVRFRDTPVPASPLIHALIR